MPCARATAGMREVPQRPKSPEEYGLTLSQSWPGLDWAASGGNDFRITMNVQSTIIVNQVSYVSTIRPSTFHTQSQLILFKPPWQRHEIISSQVIIIHWGYHLSVPTDHTLVR